MTKHSLLSTTKLTRAYLQVLDPKHPEKAMRDRRIEFHFNPESLTRSISASQSQEKDGLRGVRVRGRGRNRAQFDDGSLGDPTETMSVQIRLDHAARLESSAPPTPARASEGAGDQPAPDPRADHGLLPDLAALETLMYPSNALAQRADDGKRAKPLRLHWPIVILHWGRRALPIRITSMTVNELLHDRELIPIRAELELSMQVLRGAGGSSAHAPKTDRHQDRLRFVYEYHRIKTPST